MPDLNTIVSKLQNNQLQTLKLYPQDATVDINDMLNDILTQLFNNISCNTLTVDEVDYCKSIFANAIITNLIDKGAQADLDTLFTQSLASYVNGKYDTIY